MRVAAVSFTPSPSRRPVRRAWALGTALLLTVLVVGGAVLLTGRGGGTDPGATGGGAARPTASAPVDLTGVVVPRERFCGRLSRAAVRAALAGRIDALSSYAPGDRVELAPAVRDVADEFGCSYAAATGARARVWIFAEPVGPARARRLGRDLDPGCRTLSRTPPFGRAAVASVCHTTKPAGRAVTLRGLFGDAWLTCRVTGSAPQPAVVIRTVQWCTTVARSLAG